MKKNTEILLAKFTSVFTKFLGKIPVINENYADIDELLTIKGVCKLLQNINIKKAMGPDLIPNIILKNCANVLASGLANHFQ